MIKAITSSNITPTIKQTTQKLLPNLAESAPKKVTQTDLLMFRQYVFSKGLELNTTAEEIKQLFELDGDEFFNASFEFLFKKLGVPEVLKPEIGEVSLPETAGMAYDPAQNKILKNVNAPKVNKATTYSFIRHELQHFLQNLAVLRHKDIGEKAANIYAEMLAQAELQVYDNYSKNQTLEEIQLIGFSEEVMNNFITLKNLIENNDEEAYTNKLKEIYTELVRECTIQHNNFRNLVIKEMGYLKENTREENRAKKFFNEFLKVNNQVGLPSYMKEDGSVHAGEYSYDIRENEALIAQDVALLDVNRHLQNENTCYIKHIKQAIDNMLAKKDENKKQLEQIVETSKEVHEKNGLKSAKDLADYLFE